MKGILVLLIHILMWPSFSQALNMEKADQEVIVQDTILPKVFVIGEYEKQFEDLSLEHNTMLLTACDNDMDVAFSKWWSMIKEMEAYSSIIGYDLKGVKTWLNVFWTKEGKIKHIAFYLKPNSKNADLVELKAFFTSFMNHYTFPLVTDRDFAHYGSASFPTFPRRVSTGKTNSDGGGANTKPLVKDSSKY